MNINTSLLGLNKYELNAYESLIKNGKSSASKISQDSGVPYGRIYDTLSSLENKGLVKTIPESTKKYIASEPKNFIELINNKKNKLKEIEKEFEKLQQIYESNEIEPVEVVKGKKNFYKIIKEKPKTKKYRYSIKYNVDAKPEWLRGYEEKLKKGIDMKNLVRDDKETHSNIKKWKEVLPEIRKIDNKGVIMSLIDNNYVLIGLLKSNTTIVIRDKAFSDIIRKMYLATYEKAEKIN